MSKSRTPALTPLCSLIHSDWQWPNNHQLSSDSDSNAAKFWLVHKAPPTSNQSGKHNQKTQIQKSLMWNQTKCLLTLAGNRESMKEPIAQLKANWRKKKSTGPLRSKWHLKSLNVPHFVSSREALSLLKSFCSKLVMTYILYQLVAALHWSYMMLHWLKYSNLFA